MSRGANLDNASRGDYDCAPAGTPAVAPAGLIRVGPVPIYAVDAIVRRASALQRTPVPCSGFGVYVHPEQAVRAGLSAEQSVQISQNGHAVPARVFLDDAVPVGCVRIPAGVAGSEGLGPQIGPVEIMPLGGQAG